MKKTNKKIKNNGIKSKIASELFGGVTLDWNKIKESNFLDEEK